MEPEGSLPCSQELAPFLSQMRTVHTFPLYFPKINYSIIFPFVPLSYELSFPSGFPTNILYAYLIFPVCTTCPSHLTLLDLITPIIFGEASCYEALHYAVFSSLPPFPPS